MMAPASEASSLVPASPPGAMCKRKNFGSFGYIRQWYGIPDDESEAEQEVRGEQQPRRCDGDTHLAKDIRTTEKNQQKEEVMLRDVLPNIESDSREELDVEQQPRIIANDEGKTEESKQNEEVCRAVDDRLFDFEELDVVESSHVDIVNKTCPVLPTGAMASASEKVQQTGPQTLPLGFGFSALDMLHTPKAVATPKAVIVETTATLPTSDSAFQRQVSDVTFDFDELEEEERRRGSNTSTDTSDLDYVADAGMESQVSTAASEISAMSGPPENSKARIAMVIVGSRGDIVPFIALAEELILRGYAIRVITNANLVRHCKDRGIDAVAAFADTQEVIRRSGGMEGSEAWSMQAENIKHTQAWCRENKDAWVEPEVAAAQFNPTLVIGSFLGQGICTRIEAQLKVPAVTVYLQAEGLKSQLHSRPSDPPRPVILAGRVDMYVKENVLNTPGLEVTAAMQPRGKQVMESLAEDSQELKDLQHFLRAGSKPVAVGWGSMTMKNMGPHAMLGIALKSLYMSGRRGVILGGWAGLEELGRRYINGDFTKEDRKLMGGNADSSMMVAWVRQNVFFISEAPHRWLLPQCSCYVTHGGAGSVQSSMRAGCPMVVTPIFMDQYDNAAFVQRLGYGRGFEQPLAKIHEHDLVKGIRYAEKCQDVVAKVGKQMRDDEEEEGDGASVGAAIIETFLAKVKQGMWGVQLRLANMQNSKKTAQALAFRTGPPAAVKAVRKPAATRTLKA